MFIPPVSKSPVALYFLVVSVCPYVRTYVRTSMQIFSVFSATAYPIDTVFTIDATTHVNFFNDNYDVIGHMGWQPHHGRN